MPMKWNDFSPFTLQTSLPFLIPELFPHSALNPTFAAMTLLFSRPTVIAHTIINGECNYCCIRQGYHYSSLEVKSLGSGERFSVDPEASTCKVSLLMTPVREKLNNPNNQINRGNNIDMCWLDFQSYNKSSKKGK